MLLINPKRFGKRVQVRVTIKDVAKKVNLSVTTVSRALHDHDDVNPQTKKRIIEAAKEMGYTPNIFAQRLQKQSADAIGLVLPTFSPRFADPFFSELLTGIGNKAAELGFDLLVSTRAPGEQEIETYKNLIDGKRVDGFIIVRTRVFDPRIEYLISQNFDFVAFGRSESSTDYAYVDEDGYFGMQLIAEHVAELGHTQIGCITSNPDLNFTRYRMMGLQDSLSKHHITLNEKYIRIGDLTQKSGYEQTLELLQSPDPPTAIVAFNDLMAFGAMSAAQELGLTVGHDLSVTGFDDIPMAEFSHPSLTTVSQPVYKIGSLLCEMLIHKILGEPEDRQQIVLKPLLEKRNSTSYIRS
jgi:LacI family transcriptional regulator